MFENTTIKWMKDPFTDEDNIIKVIYNGTNKVLYVPIAEDNTDYQNILKWVAEVDENGVSKGNTIEEAD